MSRGKLLNFVVLLAFLITPFLRVLPASAEAPTPTPPDETQEISNPEATGTETQTPTPKEGAIETVTNEGAPSPETEPSTELTVDPPSCSISANSNNEGWVAVTVPYEGGTKDPGIWWVLHYKLTSSSSWTEWTGWPNTDDSTFEAGMLFGQGEYDLKVDLLGIEEEVCTESVSVIVAEPSATDTPAPTATPTPTETSTPVPTETPTPYPKDVPVITHFGFDFVGNREIEVHAGWLHATLAEVEWEDGTSFGWNGPYPDGDGTQRHVVDQSLGLGPHYVTLTVTGETGTEPATQTIEVWFAEQPVITEFAFEFTGNREVTIHTGWLHANSSTITWPDGSTYQFPDGYPDGTGTATNVVHEDLGLGPHFITLTAVGLPGTGSVSQTLEVWFSDQPMITHFGFDFTGAPGEIQIHAGWLHATSAQIIWEDGNEYTFEGPYPDGDGNQSHTIDLGLGLGPHVVTLNVVGEKETSPVSQQFKVVFEPVTCSIVTEMLTRTKAQTTFTWGGITQGAWYHFFWGDEVGDKPEPPGYQGPSGSATWKHVYNPGTWEQWSTPQGPGGYGECKNVVVVKEQKGQKPDPSPAGNPLPINVDSPANGVVATSPNGVYKMVVNGKGLTINQPDGGKFDLGLSCTEVKWLADWTILCKTQDGRLVLTDRLGTFERNLGVDNVDSIEGLSSDGEWVKYQAEDGSVNIVSIHGEYYGNYSVNSPIVSHIAFPALS